MHDATLMQSLRRPHVEARHADKKGARASFVAAAYVGAALLLLHVAGFV